MKMKRNRAREAEVTRVAKGIARLVELPDLRLAKKDQSVVGDLGSVYMWCGVIRHNIDALLKIPVSRRTAGLLRRKMGLVAASLDALPWYHRDLSRPLDHLNAKLGRLSRDAGKKRGRPSDNGA